MGLNLDLWIEKLRKCEYLAENEIKLLCDYVKEILVEESNVQVRARPPSVADRRRSCAHGLRSRPAAVRTVVGRSSALPAPPSHWAPTRPGSGPSYAVRGSARRRRGGSGPCGAGVLGRPPTLPPFAPSISRVPRDSADRSALRSRRRSR